MKKSNQITNEQDIYQTFIKTKNRSYFPHACFYCKSYANNHKYINCTECIANCFNINFKQFNELCEFCKGLMERYYQCAPKIDLPMFIDYDHPPMKHMRQFIGAWMKNYKIVL